MTDDELNAQYFNWMCGLIYKDEYSNSREYQMLLRFLDAKQFTPTLFRDDNRAVDGVDLRYRFGCDEDINDVLIASILDIRPCSVLEMMVALALRCEEQIMYNPDIGNRMGLWFWNMIESLGFDKANWNIHRIDFDYANYVIDRFLSHKYARDGHGGLFTIEHSDCDMRKMEIWYQMNHYLTANNF